MLPCIPPYAKEHLSMKRKKKASELPLGRREGLDVSLIGNVKKSSIIIRQVEKVLVFTPNVIRFSVDGGEVELSGAGLDCSVFWNRAFRITGRITRIDILERR
jgi:hypothetical protein